MPQDGDGDGGDVCVYVCMSHDIGPSRDTERQDKSSIETKTDFFFMNTKADINRLVTEQICAWPHDG